MAYVITIRRYKLLVESSVLDTQDDMITERLLRLQTYAPYVL